MSSVCLKRIVRSFFLRHTHMRKREHYRLVYDCFLVRFYWFVSRGWKIPPGERVEKNKPVSILTHLQSCVISVRRVKAPSHPPAKSTGIRRTAPFMRSLKICICIIICFDVSMWLRLLLNLSLINYTTMLSKTTHLAKIFVWISLHSCHFCTFPHSFSCFLIIYLSSRFHLVHVGLSLMLPLY